VIIGDAAHGAIADLRAGCLVGLRKTQSFSQVPARSAAAQGRLPFIEQQLRRQRSSASSRKRSGSGGRKSTGLLSASIVARRGVAVRLQGSMVTDKSLGWILQASTSTGDAPLELEGGGPLPDQTSRRLGGLKTRNARQHFRPARASANLVVLRPLLPSNPSIASFEGSGLPIRMRPVARPEAPIRVGAQQCLGKRGHVVVVRAARSSKSRRVQRA